MGSGSDEDFVALGRSVAANIAREHGFTGSRKSAFMAHVEDMIRAAEGVSDEPEDMEPMDASDQEMSDALDKWVAKVCPDRSLN